MSDKLEKIQQLMPLGKMQEVNALVESALQEGISPQERVDYWRAWMS